MSRVKNSRGDDMEISGKLNIPKLVKKVSRDTFQDGDFRTRVVASKKKYNRKQKYSKFIED